MTKYKETYKAAQVEKVKRLVFAKLKFYSSLNLFWLSQTLLQLPNQKND